ncbi:MAG: hypothetical protein SNJ29_13450 [Rikenellaceae bacterium]
METKKSNKYEKIVYIALIVILIIYGMLKDSAAATALMDSLKNAFSIILI